MRMMMSRDYRSQQDRHALGEFVVDKACDLLDFEPMEKRHSAGEHQYMSDGFQADVDEGWASLLDCPS